MFQHLQQARKQLEEEVMDLEELAKNPEYVNEKLQELENQVSMQLHTIQLHKYSFLCFSDLLFVSRLKKNRKSGNFNAKYSLMRRNRQWKLQSNV